MGNHKKTQEGVFIALFALSTLVVISLAIGFMSNTVNDLLAGQGQVMAGKQSYWLAYSGMEITSTNRFAGIPAGTNTYTLEGGTITTVGANVGAGKFNGSDITDVITSTGAIADGSRQLKWTLGNPNPADYALFFDGDLVDFVDIGTIEEKMKMQLSCNEDVEEHTTKTLCDDGAAAHDSEGPGNFNKIEYADDGVQADFSISLWLKPDYSEMPTFGVFFAVNNCVDAPLPEQGCNNERGIVMGLTDDAPASLGELRIWHDGNLKDPTVFSGTEVSADSWNHVVYTRSAATPGAGVGTIYLNGVLLGTDNPDNSWFKDADDGELWYLDTDIDVGPVKSQNYAGGLDEVAIWRKVLSLAEIQSLYIQGMSFDIATNMEANLVAYWDFNNNSDDQSLPGYDATVTGAAYTGF